MKSMCWFAAIWLALLVMVGIAFAGEEQTPQKKTIPTVTVALDRDVVVAEDTIGKGNRVFVREYETKEDGARYIIKVTGKEGGNTSWVRASVYIATTLVVEMYARRSPDAERECKKVGNLLEMAKPKNLRQITVYWRDSQGTMQSKEYKEDPTAPNGGDIEKEAQASQ